MRRGDDLRILFFIFVAIFAAWIFSLNIFVFIILFFVWRFGLDMWLKKFDPGASEGKKPNYFLASIWPTIIFFKLNTFDAQPEDEKTYCKSCCKEMVEVTLLRAVCTNVDEFPVNDEGYKSVATKYCADCDTLPRERLVECKKKKQCLYRDCFYRKN